MKNYLEIKNKHPELSECFFAFSDDQFKKGLKEAGIEGQKIFHGGAGLYGTKGGIKKLFADYDKIDQEVAENCDPQEVYNYEFANHECSYTNDDEEPINIVVRIFGKERAEQVKRRFAYTEIN